MKYICYCLLLMLCCSQIRLSAQERSYTFLHYTEKDGLSSNVIADLVQDSSGMIWITSKRGLSYFDGKRFHHVQLRSNPDLSTNYLGNIAIDSKNRIWITTNTRGLLCYDRSLPLDQEIKVYAAKIAASGLTKTNLYDVMASRTGLVYFSGQETDLQVLDPETGIIRQLPFKGIKGPKQVSIYRIEEHPDGSIWLGTRYHGLIRYSPKDGTYQQIDLQNVGENGVAGFVFGVDHFFAGYYDYDLISANYTFQDLQTRLLDWSTNQNFYDNFITTMCYVPSEQALLLGHVSNGLWQFDPRTKIKTHIRWDDLMPDLPKPSRVHALCAVDSGFWVGTESGLFFYSSHRNRINQLIPPKKFEKPILQLLQWHNAIWYRTENSFGRMSPDLKNRLSAISLKGIAVSNWNASQDALYFSTYDQGVYSYTHTAKQLMPLPIIGESQHFRKADCNVVLQDSIAGYNYLWIGAWNSGIYRYDLTNKTIRLFGPREGLPDHKVISIGKDGDGTIWLGMDGYGLVKMDNKLHPTFTQYTHKTQGADNLQSNTVLSFFLDAKKRFWYGSGASGIGEIVKTPKGYSFRHYRDLSAAPYLSPTWIGADQQQQLWIKALDGTMIFHPEHKQFVHLKAGDGSYPNSTYMSYGYLIDGNQLIWCTDKGLLVGMLPDLFRNQIRGLQPQISRFQLDHSDESYRLYGTEIDLKAGENNISFAYGLPAQVNLEGLRFAYMLEGQDMDWILGSDEQAAYYNNLEGGHYTFKVRVGDALGNWSPEMATVGVHLDRYWYATMWFKLLIVGLLVLLISLFYRYRLREHKRIHQLQVDYNTKLEADLAVKVQTIQEQAAAMERDRQEKLETEYKQKLYESELKAIRSQMNPHFIFNVLNSIEAYVVENDSHNASQLIQKFATLSRIVLENSQYAMVSLRSEIQLLSLYLELERERFNQGFDFEIQYDRALNMEGYSIPSMLIQPLVENAVHHGIRNKHPDQGNVLVDIQVADYAVHITIWDNGIGFEKSEGKGKRGFKSNSFGIKGVQERITIINQAWQPDSACLEINVGEMRPGFTTKVYLRLPLEVGSGMG